jgi:hypothetical protein
LFFFLGGVGVINFFILYSILRSLFQTLSFKDNIAPLQSQIMAMLYRVIWEFFNPQAHGPGKIHITYRNLRWYHRPFTFINSYLCSNSCLVLDGVIYAYSIILYSLSILSVYSTVLAYSIHHYLFIYLFILFKGGLSLS